MAKTKKTSFDVLMQKANKAQLVLTLTLILITVSLLFANIAKAEGLFYPNLNIELQDSDDHKINLDDWSVEQKVAQMIVVHAGLSFKEEWQRMGLGGVHIFALESEELYQEYISDFQDGMSIPFFVTADLEGCQNPFAAFKDFTPNSEISTIEAAKNKATEEGEFLSNLGFTINFAPVVDLEDNIWGCRNFPGSDKEVAELANTYSQTLESKQVSSTMKHYPGKTLVGVDPHKDLAEAVIEESDLFPYVSTITSDNPVDFIMVSHVITSGEVDSNGKPASVSKEVISKLKEDYNGLVISDDIIMLGLINYYGGDKEQMYIDLVSAGNDMMINFVDNSDEVWDMIKTIANAVEDGTIDENQIDESVTKILELKGFEVVS